MEAIELYNKIKDQIKRNQYYGQIVNEEDKETILNDTFMYIWQKIKEDKLSNQWEEIEDYSYISCRNNCLGYLRKVNRRPHQTELESEFGKEYAIEEEKEYEFSDKKYDMEQILNLIKFDGDREVIQLRLKGYSLKEIAQILNLDLDKVININRTTIKYIRKVFNNEKILIRKKKEYQVINSDTGEIIFKTKNKREIADKYKLSRKYIDRYIDTNTIFNQNLIVKSLNL